ncbi:hypothetical protein PGTUg99_006113 [Puccinia graminis f. sp. tritici]|uniref:Uncharacterized protein n=1 Tax=Puccinia graminis f. sp. tritici TaxID=56615 RepID=A0A5B0NQE0_PUCGR|nr:hypothetical protein PGTUg99_006113 [Puccinia graminis f. sp. tritici]
MVAHIQSLLPSKILGIPVSTVDQGQRAHLSFWPRGLSPKEWLQAVEGKCPKMYMFPNEHLFANPLIRRQALDSALQNLSADIPWAEKRFVRFAAVFQQHRASAKVGLPSPSSLQAPTTPWWNWHQSQVGAWKPHLLSNYIPAAKTSPWLSPTQRTYHLLCLHCLWTLAFVVFYLGPCKPVTAPPTSAAQIISMLKTLIDRDFSLPSENFWTHNHIS